MEKLDDIHFTTRDIDGCDKPLNMVLSPRRDGKTTTVIIKKCVPAWQRGEQTIVFRRFITDITEEYCESFAKIENKFGFRTQYYWKQKQKDEGICHLYDATTNESHYTIVALNAPIGRLKAAFEANVTVGLFDEFEIDLRLGEKYLKGEAFRFKEAFTTFNRESHGRLKIYLLGNPYSFYNPYFVSFGVNPRRLAEEGIITGENWAAQYHHLSPELEKIALAENPLLNEEDPYCQYALHGCAINDTNIKIVTNLPQRFALAFFLTVDGKSLAVYQSQDWEGENQFWVGYKGNARNASAFAFDFADLAEGCVMFSRQENWQIMRFARAIRSRKVAFATLECDYLVEEIYPSL